MRTSGAAQAGKLMQTPRRVTALLPAPAKPTRFASPSRMLPEPSRSRAGGQRRIVAVAAVQRRRQRNRRAMMER
jgi:hypothetical protein